MQNSASKRTIKGAFRIDNPGMNWWKRRQQTKDSSQIWGRNFPTLLHLSQLSNVSTVDFLYSLHYTGTTMRTSHCLAFFLSSALIAFSCSASREFKLVGAVFLRGNSWIRGGRGQRCDAGDKLVEFRGRRFMRIRFTA